MKVIIAGGRSFNNYNLLYIECNNYLDSYSDIEIVSGCANGADRLGERYALEKGYSITKFPANWNAFGKSAGYIRNEEMAKYADILIAFWDGDSKGTKHMINLAEKYKLKVNIIKY